MDYVSEAIARADTSEWITSGAYLLAAILCLSSARWARLSRNPAERLFWLCGAAATIFLGMNDLLDLQTLLTHAGKQLAEGTGWYADRRSYQAAFVAGLALTGGIAFLAAAWLIRRLDASLRLAMLGFFLISVFALVQAAAFNRMDEFLGKGFIRSNTGSILEIGGIMFIALAAQIYLLRRTRRGTVRRLTR